MTVIVGGTSRKVGKTTTVCAIISATSELAWTAVKISPHGHGASLDTPMLLAELEPSETTDTARFLKAGAQKSYWIRCKAPDVARMLGQLQAQNLIIESNAAVGEIASDLVFLVQREDDREAKASTSKVAQLADALIEWPDVSPAVDAVQRRLLAEAR
jgi:molybdopterin-guanine dinucleotide biosynthesis protein